MRRIANLQAQVFSAALEWLKGKEIDATSSNNNDASISNNKNNFVACADVFLCAFVDEVKMKVVLKGLKVESALQTGFNEGHANEPQC